MKKRNNEFRYILLVLLFVAVLLAAMLGYKALTKVYVPEQQKAELSPGTFTAETEGNDNTEEETAAKETEEAEEVIAPDFTVLDADGNSVTLADRLAEGKPVVLNFWATWCGPCKSELPAFEKAAAEYADEITFMFINLTDGYQETVDGVKEFMEENGYTFPVYFDTEYSAVIPYGASSIPLTYFITSDGIVAGGYMGAMPEETLYDYLEQLMELENG